MFDVRISKPLRLASLILLTLPVAACGGGGPSGEYTAKHPDSPLSFIEKFDFQSGGKVAVTALGDTSVGEFVVMDDGGIRVIMPQGNTVKLQSASGGCILAVSDPQLIAEAAKDGVDLNELGLYCH